MVKYGEKKWTAVNHVLAVNHILILYTTKELAWRTPRGATPKIALHKARELFEWR